MKTVYAPTLTLRDIGSMISFQTKAEDKYIVDNPIARITGRLDAIAVPRGLEGEVIWLYVGGHRHLLHDEPVTMEASP